MANQWFIWRDGQGTGPMSTEKLKQIAASGTLLPTDLIQKEGDERRVRASAVKGLFPTSTTPPAPERPPSPSPQRDKSNQSETPLTTSAPDRPAGQVAGTDQVAVGAEKFNRVTRKFPLSRLGIVAAAISVILGIALIVVVRLRNQPVSDSVEVVHTTSAEPAAPTARAESSDGGTAPARDGGRADRATPPTASAIAAATVEGFELPPVGPTTAAATDRVALEYKIARTAYQDAQKEAREEIRVQFLKRREEIDDGEPAPKDPELPKQRGGFNKGRPNPRSPKLQNRRGVLNRGRPSPRIPNFVSRGEIGNRKPDPRDSELKQYNDQLMAFAYGAGKSQDSGPLPTHPVMASAVAEYWQTLETAAREFGAVADRGLAAYEKAGVTDPAKLRPLQAASLAGKHADLLGIWSSSGGMTQHDVWIVDVDESAGGWRVEGSLNYRKGTTGHLYHAEEIKLDGGTLSFEASPVDTTTKKVRGAGTAVSLKLRDGELLYQGPAGVGKPGPKTLVRSGEESARNSIAYWGVPKAPSAELSDAIETPDLADPNYVWRRIAMLSSFPAYRGKGGLPGGEQFYLPYRSNHPTLTSGPYGPLADMLLGRSPGGGKNQAYAEALFQEFEELADSPQPYLSRAAGEFLALCRARIQLAEADELLGNTPNSSIRQFQQTVMLPSAKYVFQRELDRAELQDKLERAYPDERFIVFDAPMSDASRKHLGSLLKGASGLMDDVKQRSLVSGLLSYADMAQVDRASALWQTWLLPLAKKCGGPPSSSQLIDVEGDWSVPITKDRTRFKGLKEFRLKNMSGQDLTHAVVELIAENEWGDKAAQYYYFSQFDVAEVARLVPHPRWERRRLPFTNTVQLKWSVCSDQGSEVNQQAKLTNPTPNPDPDEWRKNYLDNDRQYQAEGEALGAIVRNFPFLPIKPERQRHRLLMIAAAGSTYAVQRSEKEKPLIVRFLTLDADKATVALEVFDLAGRKPYHPGTPVWKGHLNADANAGFVINLDEGWTIQLANDDQPGLSTPVAGESSTTLAPLVRVKLP
ncbi:MAG: DUF4339 domain-containing protein [Isosphaeraceae bacterium]